MGRNLPTLEEGKVKQRFDHTGEEEIEHNEPKGKADDPCLDTVR